MLTALILLPLLAALALACVPRSLRFGIRLATLLTTALGLLLALALFARFDAAPEADGYKFQQRTPWVVLGEAGPRIDYHVGVDGINLGLIVMAAIVAFAAACAAHEIREREKEFHVLLLVMVGGIIGAFASLDLFMLYFFHELALVPTFIMIGVWGRGPDRNYATFKITLYLSLGALVALVGLILLYLGAGAHSFDLVDLTRQVAASPIAPKLQRAIFPLLMFGFGILVSLWPFHTWAPMAYAAAPTPTAMFHAGVLKKFGVYALLRVALPLLPEGGQRWLPLLAWLALGNILYCGLVALRQKDLNLLIGNSSVAHMGFVFLGLASINLVGVTGAVVIMVAHGLLAALSFGLTGYLYAQSGTLELSALGGLARRMPFVGAALLMALLAGCGLPGFANFVGEAMVFFGAWKTFPLVTVLAAWGAMVIGAVYMLRAARSVLHGPPGDETRPLPDAASPWRRLPFVLLLAALIAAGVWPRLLTDKIAPRAAEIVRAAHPTDAAAGPQVARAMPRP